MISKSKRRVNYAGRQLDGAATTMVRAHAVPGKCTAEELRAYRSEHRRAAIAYAGACLEFVAEMETEKRKGEQ